MPGKPNNSPLSSCNKPWLHRGRHSLLLALGQVPEGQALAELALVEMAELALVGMVELALVGMAELAMVELTLGNHHRWYIF